MLDLLRDTAAHHHRTRLELVDPKLRFGALGDVVEIEAQVERMLDFHMESATPPSDQCGQASVLYGAWSTRRTASVMAPPLRPIAFPSASPSS